MNRPTPPDENPVKIAIVHERLTEIAGSENVVGQLAREWPDAPISIPIVDPRVRAEFADRVITGPLSTAYRALGYRTYAPLLPLTPAWFRWRNFGSADVVIISHHAFAAAAVEAAGSRKTIVYVHSPARWAWDKNLRSAETRALPGRIALEALARVAVATELRAADKITALVANSTAVADRIRTQWDRESEVVHPPVDTDFFTPDPAEPIDDFFLLAGRVVSYKGPDIAIKAAAAANVKLIVAGDGRERKRCEKIAGGENVTFVGRVSDDEMRRLMRRAKACLMPAEEDFGIIPVEAMACGTPVIALGAGGVLDSVIDGNTGTLVDANDDATLVERFADALASFDRSSFDPVTIRRHAETFSRLAFRRAMAEVVDSVVAGSP